VRAALDAGYQAGFYNVDAALQADEDDLRSRVSRRPGPVLLIHYFGFPQPGLERIARLCAEYGCTLIEDCAHALFSHDESGRELGSVAPLAIYSLRKTLPVMDGGALRAGADLAGSPLLRRFAFTACGTYVKDAVRSMIGPRLTALYRKMASAAPPDSPSYGEPMFCLSRAVAAKSQPAEVVSLRRWNYIALDRMLRQVSEYRPVWRELPQGTCPLFLPVWTASRSEMMRRLASAGIESFRFGASSPYRVDAGEFPATAKLRDSILCLPIHQDLDGADLCFLADRFRRAAHDCELSEVSHARAC
jgi:dTDP-4-amino-4,6-dideoxygalactose transaminase